jgi:hypothetical protein
MCAPCANVTVNASALSGLVWTVFDLPTVTQNLVEKFPDPDRIVVVIERSSGILLALSLPGNYTHFYSLTPAINSSNPLVSSISQWLVQNNYPQYLAVVGSNYVQTTRFNKFPGIDWWLIVIMPAPVITDSVCDFLSPNFRARIVFIRGRKANCVMGDRLCLVLAIFSTCIVDIFM